MSNSDLAAKLVSPIDTFAEKSIKLRFALHVLCLLFYLDISCYVYFASSALRCSWSSVEHLTIGSSMMFVALYVFIMGVVLHVVYEIVAWAFMHLPRRERSEKNIDTGFVDAWQVQRYSFDNSDYSLFNIFHRQIAQSANDREEFRNLSYPTLALLFFLAIDYLFVPSGISVSIYDWLYSIIGAFATLLIFLFIGVLVYILRIDADWDYSQSEYLYFPPLAKMLVNERDKDKHINFPPTRHE